MNLLLLVLIEHLQNVSIIHCIGRLKRFLSGQNIVNLSFKGDQRVGTVQGNVNRSNVLDKVIDNLTLRS